MAAVAGSSPWLRPHGRHFTKKSACAAWFSAWRAAGPEPASPRAAGASVPPRGVAGPYIATVSPFPGELGSDSVSERWKHTSSVRHHTLPALSSRLEHRRVDYAQKEQSGPLRHRGRDPEGQAELGDGEVAGPECWGPHDSQV